MATYFVLGAASFLGSNFVHYVLREDEQAQVVSIDALDGQACLASLQDLSEEERHTFAHVARKDAVALDRLFTKYGPDYVVSFDSPGVAGKQGGAAALDDLATLLEIARADWEEPDKTFGEKRFLQVSSACVYGLPDEMASEEDALHPCSAEAASAAAADLLALAAHAQYGFPVCVARVGDAFGQEQFPTEPVAAAICAALDAKCVPAPFGDQSTGQVLHADDCSRGLETILQNGQLGEVYNIANPAQIDAAELVRAVKAGCAAALKSSEAIKEEAADKPTARKVPLLATAKLEALGWKPQRPFVRALADTIVWYFGNKEWVDEAASGGYKQRNEELLNPKPVRKRSRGKH